MLISFWEVGKRYEYLWNTVWKAGRCGLVESAVWNSRSKLAGMGDGGHDEIKHTNTDVSVMRLF